MYSLVKPTFANQSNAVFHHGQRGFRLRSRTGHLHVAGKQHLCWLLAYSSGKRDVLSSIHPSSTGIRVTGKLATGAGPQQSRGVPGARRNDGNYAGMRAAPKPPSHTLSRPPIPSMGHQGAPTSPVRAIPSRPRQMLEVKDDITELNVARHLESQENLTKHQSVAPQPSNPLSLQGLSEWALAMRRKYVGVSKSKEEWNIVLQNELLEAGGAQAMIPLDYIRYTIEWQIMPGLLQDDARNPWSQREKQDVMATDRNVGPSSLMGNSLQGRLHKPDRRERGNVSSSSSALERQGQDLPTLTGSLQAATKSLESEHRLVGCTANDHNTSPRPTDHTVRPPNQDYEAHGLAERHLAHADLPPGQEEESSSVPNSPYRGRRHLYRPPASGWSQLPRHYPHQTSPDASPTDQQSHFSGSDHGLPPGWNNWDSDYSELDSSDELCGTPIPNDLDQAPNSPERERGGGRQGDTSTKYDLQPTPFQNPGLNAAQEDKPEARPGAKRNRVTFADPPASKKGRPNSDTSKTIPSIFSINTHSPPKGDTGPLPVRYDQSSYGPQSPRARAPKQAVYIRGPGCSLSNMAESTIFWKGITFRSGEMKYQYDKRSLLNDPDRPASAILETTDPFKAKELGQISKKEDRDKWAKHRVKKQVIIWQLRDAQDPIFAQDLRETGDRPLIHNVVDPFWGSYRFKEVWREGRKVKVRVNDGLNMYGRLLMAYRDEKYGRVPHFPTSLQGQQERNRHRSLCNLVRSCMLNQSEIPKLKEEQPARGPPPKVPQQFKILWGDSLLNDKGERRRGTRDLQRECRKACKDDNIFVSSTPGVTLNTMKTEASRILDTLPHIKPEQVTDLVVAGGINDVLNALQKWYRQENDGENPTLVKREDREKEADSIIQDLLDSVKAAKTFLPNARIHLTKILNHPILKSKRYGFHLRDYINDKIKHSTKLNKYPVVSHHFTQQAWKQSHDGLHLSLTAKVEYGENLAGHLFRGPRQ